MDSRIHALDRLARAGASARALRVAVVLYRHGLAGQAPTGTELAGILGMGKSQISRALGELADAGIIARDGYRGPITLRSDLQPIDPMVTETSGCASSGYPLPGQSTDSGGQDEAHPAVEVAAAATCEVATTATSPKPADTQAGEVAAAATASDEVANAATSEVAAAATSPHEVAAAATSSPEVATAATASRAHTQRERDIPIPTDKTSPSAGEGEGAGVMDQPVGMPRIRKILQDRGFGWQRLMQSTTNRLGREWMQAGVTEAELKAAIERAETVCRGLPDSPAYYSWAVRDEINARGKPKDGTQKSPPTGVAPVGSDQQQGGKQPPKEMVHDLYTKDYDAGATDTGDLPGFLQ